MKKCPKIYESRLDKYIHKNCRGGSRISPGGRQLTRGAATYDFTKFSRKLHEIERIWVPSGGARPPRPPKSVTAVSEADTSRQTPPPEVHAGIHTPFGQNEDVCL